MQKSMRINLRHRTNCLDWFITGLYAGLIFGLIMVMSLGVSAEVTVYGRKSYGFTANLRNGWWYG